MIDGGDILLHAASAGGGGAGVAWLARILIKGWLKRHDKMELTLDDAVKLLNRIDERVSALQLAHSRVIEHDRQIAVLQSDVREARKDLNGLGKKYRTIATDP